MQTLAAHIGIPGNIFYDMKYSIQLSDPTAEVTRQAILAPLREYNRSRLDRASTVGSQSKYAMSVA